MLSEIRRILRATHLETKRLEKEHGISLPQLMCLRFLHSCENYRSTPTEIKNELNLNASTVSGILSRLERKGFVARLPKVEDRRVSHIVLTSSGDRARMGCPTTMQEKLLSRFERLAPEKQAAITESLEWIVGALDAESIEDTMFLPGSSE